MTDKRISCRPDWAIPVASLVLILVLVASHWFFLGNLHHRIGGVAWNALFQIFGNFLAGLGALGLIGAAISGSIPRWSGLVCGSAIGMTAGYCFFRSFGIMLSI